MRGHDLAALRRLNTVAVLRALRAQSPPRPRSLSQLTAATGLSRPTVEALVEELTGQGWLTEVTDAPPGRTGRPARRFRFRAEAGQVVGVDIGLHKIVLLLSDLGGEVTVAERDDIDPHMGGVARLAFLQERLERFLTAHRVRPETLWAVCVGVPGVVADTGRITSVIVPEWTDVDLARRLGAHLPCPVLTENDVNLATLAEHWCGAAQLADDVACVLLGRRSSCGVLINGRLHRGRRGAAGEIGVLPQLGLADAHQALRWEGARRPGESEIAALARAANAEDAEALRVLDGYAARLAPGIAAVVLTLDPELIVLSGGAAPVGETLTPLLAEHLRPVTLHVPRIAVSTLGERGVALGAVRKALDSVDAALTDATRPLPSAVR